MGPAAGGRRGWHHGAELSAGPAVDGKPVVSPDRRRYPSFPRAVVRLVSRDAKWEADPRTRAERIPKLEMTGFVDKFISSRYGEILSTSRVMANTATHEGLPNAFIGAAWRSAGR